MSEKKELLNMLRIIWRNGSSPLRRIYPSWEELEAHLDITEDKAKSKDHFMLQHCPYCGETQKVTKPLDDLFPYQECHSCKRAFHVNQDLKVRVLTDEERENLPESWIRIIDDLNKKKLAIVFKLE